MCQIGRPLSRIERDGKKKEEEVPFILNSLSPRLPLPPFPTVPEALRAHKSDPAIEQN
jgi:hypothetical protein